MTVSANRFLLRVLLPVLLAAAAATLLGVKIRKMAVSESLLAGAKEELARFESRTSELGAINLEVAKLERAVENERSRYFSIDEMDPAGFGLALKRILLSLGLTVDSYKITEDRGKPFLEMAVSGSANAFVEFLYRVVSSDRYYAIAYLSINAHRGRGEIRAVLRISYAILEEELQGESGQAHEKTGPAVSLGEAGDALKVTYEITEVTRGEITRISQLFRWGGSREVASGDPSVFGSSKSSSQAAEIASGGEQRAQWLQYIGSVVRNGREYYLFKDKRSNRIYPLRGDVADPEGWRYVKSDGQFHYLEKGGTIYLVDR